LREHKGAPCQPTLLVRDTKERWVPFVT